MRLVMFINTPSPIDYVFSLFTIYEVPSLAEDHVMLRRHVVEKGQFKSQSWTSITRFKQYLRDGTLVFVD